MHGSTIYAASTLKFWRWRSCGGLNTHARAKFRGDARAPEFRQNRQN